MKSPSFVRNMKKCELRKDRYSKGKGKKKKEKGKNIKKRGLKFFFVLYSMNEQSKDGNRLNKFLYALRSAFGIRK